MNPGLPEDDVTIEYYDSDYPSETLSPFPENFDSTTEYQGLRWDVARYRELAAARGRPLRVLEACCGTGRVAIPLAEDGHRVTAVDLSAAMLDQLAAKLAQHDAAPGERVVLVQADVTELDLAERDFDLALIAFNSLLCIPDFEAQQRCLDRLAAHLGADGTLVIDVVNPLVLPVKGASVPTPFFTRRHPATGNHYTRFAMSGPFDAGQRQRLHGWYDEIGADRGVRRRHYSMHWRPIFRYELELMLERAGLTIRALEGGHRGEPYAADSPRMFVQARRETNAG